MVGAEASAGNARLMLLMMLLLYPIRATHAIGCQRFRRLAFVGSPNNLWRPSTKIASFGACAHHLSLQQQALARGNKALAVDPLWSWEQRNTGTNRSD